MCAPTLAALAAALPPEGEQFAPWGGPAARMRFARIDGAPARLRCDIEREVALDHMIVDRQHAPDDTIPAGCEPRQRHAKQRAVDAVDLRIAVVDLRAAAVQYVNAAECGLDALRETELELRWRLVHGAARGGYRGFEQGVR